MNSQNLMPKQKTPTPFTRFKSSGISFHRIYQAILRRLKNFPDVLAWYTLPLAEQNRQKLARFHNRHRGERCFIIGNGPSLKQTDLNLLKHDLAFGLNRIYLLYDSISIRPQYYVSVNELVLEQFAGEIVKIPGQKFLNWNRRQFFLPPADDVHFITYSLGIEDRFVPTPFRPVSSGGTVTFVAMQLAYFMGFQEAILIGVDHNFASTGEPNRTEVRMEDQDRDHFHPNYFPKGSRWQLPDLLRSELAYEKARIAFEQDGRRILDATIGGKCTVFEKVDYYGLFN